MDHKVSLVVLGKYRDVFEPFVQNIRQYNIFGEIDEFIFVRDGQDINTDVIKGPKIKIIQGNDPFSMAGNGNLGMKAASVENDILYVGDDVRFSKLGSVEKLQEAAYSDPLIGILSPRIIGRGSPTLVNPTSRIQEVKPLEMWFPCVYIKRDTLNKIGYLDEDFNKFGSDDLDFCIRTKLAGLKLVVFSEVAVIHQASPEGGPTTFCKKIGAEEWQKQQADSYTKLRNKYKVSIYSFEKFMATGDCKYLKEGSTVEVKDSYDEGLLCKKEDVQAFLKTRHLHIATPAYGGWLSVNYVNSLLALIDLCNELNIPRTSSFIYNESLITRARNKMSNDFLRAEKGTDFIFVDGDIGFDPRDIVMLMLRSEDIIGAPCVRKNLRLDRISEAIKKNGREYSREELEYLTGEYVFNFISDPPSINLGQLIEVRDVGTGIMRIRRETFDKYINAYPDRWVLPMAGEHGGRVPTYMFFQAAPDEDTRNTNPGGIPDYISEDYHFCREARKAGLRVWLAPWLKTTHCGTYMFKGDLEAVAKAGGSLR